MISSMSAALSCAILLSIRPLFLFMSASITFDSPTIRIASDKRWSLSSPSLSKLDRMRRCKDSHSVLTRSSASCSSLKQFRARVRRDALASLFDSRIVRIVRNTLVKDVTPEMINAITAINVLASIAHLEERGSQRTSRGFLVACHSLFRRSGLIRHPRAGVNLSAV